MSGATKRDDEEVFRLLKTELSTALVGDVLDAMGHHRRFLPAGVGPPRPDMTLAGRAMPVPEADVFDDGAAASAGPLARKPFGPMPEALDDLKPGEVYVASGSSLRYAPWGGLMSTRALCLEAAGAVLDGYVRDAAEIERLGFPAFCRGVYARDQGARGEVIDSRDAVEVGGVRVGSGDLVFGDRCRFSWFVRLDAEVRRPGCDRLLDRETPVPDRRDHVPGS